MIAKEKLPMDTLFRDHEYGLQAGGNAVFKVPRLMVIETDVDFIRFRVRRMDNGAQPTGVA